MWSNLQDTAVVDTIYITRSFFDTFNWSDVFTFLGIALTGWFGIITLKINKTSKNTNVLVNGDKAVRDRIIVDQQAQILALSEQIAVLNAERLLKTPPPSEG